MFTCSQAICLQLWCYVISVSCKSCVCDWVCLVWICYIVCVCVSLTACVGSDTELIDESYSLYGVKLPTAGRSIVTPQPRSQFPAPAVVPYDATRYAHPPASTNTVVYWEQL
jgi:hypothetical protein